MKQIFFFFCFTSTSAIYLTEDGEVLNDLKPGTELSRATNLDSRRSLPGFKWWISPTNSVILGELFNIFVKLVSFFICKIRKIPHIAVARIKFIELKYL